MKLRNLIFSLFAGLGATAVHIVLMEIKHRAAILPGFEPYDGLHQLLTPLAVQGLEPPLSWLIPDINGALLLGFVFGQLFAYLPGRSAVAKGAGFGLVAWLMMGFGLLPLTGLGLFASELSLGVLPAVLMFVMLMVYSIVMSLLYAWLTMPVRTHDRT
jgi:hypothetical protein